MSLEAQFGSAVALWGTYAVFNWATKGNPCWVAKLVRWVLFALAFLATLRFALGAI